MSRWLRLQWHRFTLGRTARIAIASPCPGSTTMALVAWETREAMRRCIRLGIEIEAEVVVRTALDVPSGTVRAVLETCE